AILQHPAISRALDEEALYHYLTFLATPAPQTLFAGIQKLPAGCILTCDARGEVKVTRYWDAIVDRLDPSEFQDENVVAEEVLRLLRASISKRMMSDVPFGVFLSGGIDSTANVALMAELMDRPVRTFTVGYRDNQSYNEIEEARAVAREYGADHHEVLIGQQELLDFLPEMVFHQDEPIADPVCVPLYYLSKLARENGTTVIQVGEGSDEMFCGYRDYARYLRFHDLVWRHLSRAPASVRGLAGAAGQAFCRFGGASLFPKLGKILPDLMRRLTAGEDLFWSGNLIFDEVNKRRLIKPEARARLAAANGGAFPSSHSIVRADLDRLLAAKPSADQLDQMIYAELKLRLPELLLMRVDKMTMATSVEARVPFLDHKLVEFAMALPSQLKYRNGETKYILKRALKSVLPARMINRKKKGFGVPINEWMLDQLGGFVEASLFDSSLWRRGLFDYGFVRQLLTEHRARRANYSFFLWSLLNLSLWYDRWIEGPAPKQEARETNVTLRV
ncbi:MAG: asparagine synthase (glutamine-hydrolyzing), partial [Blastocatellia bacterium]